MVSLLLRRSSMKRRTFLKGLATAAAAAGAGRLVGPGVRRASAAAGTYYAPFPTIVIQLRGGVDVVMAFDARTGFVNRDVTTASIGETPSGIRYHTPLVGAMASHLQDGSIIHNLRGGGGDHFVAYGNLWFGPDSPEQARVTMPWANYLASRMLTQRRVPGPNLVIHEQLDDKPISQYVAHNNASPPICGPRSQLVFYIPDLIWSPLLLGWACRHRVPPEDHPGRIGFLLGPLTKRCVQSLTPLPFLSRPWSPAKQSGAYSTPSCAFLLIITCATSYCFLIPALTTPILGVVQHNLLLFPRVFSCASPRAAYDVSTSFSLLRHVYGYT